MTATEKPLHIRQAEGLRALADMIEANPEIAPLSDWSARNLYMFSSNTPADHAALVRAALKSGAQVEKKISDSQYNLVLRFNDAVGAYVLASRDDVCERVVTGTETVTKTVPDPDALAAVPTVEVTEEIEQVEWVCRPLLAPESGSDGAA